MKLVNITISGADNQVPIDFINSISNRYPWVEWGILLSERNAARDRYPASTWVQDLREAILDNGNIRASAHLCGDTMRQFMLADPEFIAPWELDLDDFVVMFKRFQINFDARQEGFSQRDIFRMINYIDDLYLAYGDHEEKSPFITQHNDANTDVWHIIQQQRKKFEHVNEHHVLHDCSRGRGVSPGEWPLPIGGVLTGYAGGIGPDNVEEVLFALERMIPHGYTWIDMESSVRDEFNRFDLKKVEHVLSTCDRLGEHFYWFDKKESSEDDEEIRIVDEDEEEDIDIEELFRV